MYGHGQGKGEVLTESPPVRTGRGMRTFAETAAATVPCLLQEQREEEGEGEEEEEDKEGEEIKEEETIERRWCTVRKKTRKSIRTRTR